jgi:acetylornithine/succinyldiaminopimelate/putrescine aminotransferase
MLASGYRARLAKKLAEITPGDLQYTTFGCSGGEAIDFALKLARGYTKKTGVISAIKGYHGHTGFALAATDDYGDRYGPLTPGFRKVPHGDFDALAASVDDDTAAIIMESIPGSASTCPPDDWYPGSVNLRRDRHRDDPDEVQAAWAAPDVSGRMRNGTWCPISWCSARE